MSREPQISVIVPMYNAREFIEECVVSILGQSMGDFELLLLDDGSTDGTLELCRCLWGGEDRVRLFANGRTMGPGLTRNRGMEEARGKYIAFVDADDFVKKGYLAALWNVAEQCRADVVSMGYTEFVPKDSGFHGGESGEEGKEHLFSSERYEAGKKIQLVPRPSMLPPDVRRRMELMVGEKLLANPWGKLLRRDFLERHGLRFENIVSEDVLFHFLLLYHAGNYMLLPDILYGYRQAPSSITRGTGLDKTRRVLSSAVLVQRHIARYLSGMPEIGENSMLAARIRGWFAELFWDPVFFRAAEGIRLDEIMGVAWSVFSELLPEDAAFVSFFFQKAIHARSVKAAE